ncbi:hypothetical protein VDGD_21244 [Verticillium dahliae]|nr:hypothetical protein VDGD_21244 [Verticillium dahliae]
MGLSFWKPQTAVEVASDRSNYNSDSENSVIHDGKLAYVRFAAGNGSGPSYQEAAGAPVESKSPLGYHVNWLTVIFLNINMMIGTGIFSTRKSCPLLLSRMARRSSSHG